LAHQHCKQGHFSVILGLEGNGTRSAYLIIKAVSYQNCK